MNEQKTIKILRFESLPSTNEYAKTLRPTGEDTLIIAASQTGGKGTKGRSFSSNTGGLYLSALNFYENFPSANAFLIMAKAATAVCKTLESFSLIPKIKWPNDVYVNGKKICGILIENAFLGDKIKNSIVGIGLNVNNLLPDELSEIATTMNECLQKETPLDLVEERLIGLLYAEFSFEEYCNRLGFLNEPATLVTGEKTLSVVPRGVNERGELLAEEQGVLRAFSSAEISLRF